MIALYSKKAFRIPFLSAFLGEEVAYAPRMTDIGFSAIAGWGLRPSTHEPRRLAQDNGLPFLALEDGFLRSAGLGCDDVPPLSLVVDPVGMYYDATTPSALENILNGPSALSGIEQDSAVQALSMILRHSLCKYNQTKAMPEDFCDSSHQNVLIVDQTVGDASVHYGLADAATFDRMIEAARDENPHADCYLKVHPDVMRGKKRGFLASRAFDSGIKIIPEDYNPHSLIRHMDKVYVVTSQLGFEALMHGKDVICFGMPFYAGWGATDDRVACLRRTAKRSVQEIFSAAYCRYARYVNPTTGRAGSIFDVIGHLIHQQKWQSINCDDYVCFGVQPWKRRFIRPFLQGSGNTVHFAGSARHAKQIAAAGSPRVIVWGHRQLEEARRFAEETNSQVWHMEDGFIRSVGLGSDIVPPLSMTVDRQGAYFDPASENELRQLLATHQFTDETRERAARVRELIVSNNITKYNVGRIEDLGLSRAADRRIIFVPGQVETDASVLCGAQGTLTNEMLLREVRNAHPDAFLIYKPHPDIVARNRPGSILPAGMVSLCDQVEMHRSVLSCIAAADEVHTITSLSGFDALMRGKQVTTYGRPFYAGWGLTIDRLPCPGRTRTLTLDELVAGTLLLYPRYFDYVLGIHADCETIIHRIIYLREQEKQHTPTANKPPYFLSRQARRVARMVKGILFQ